VLIVENDEEAVEADLAAGRLRCAACQVGVLLKWGFARRRTLRDGRELRPRRGMCASCETSHVLLPDVCLVRRRDSAAAIGAALLSVVAERRSVEDVAVLRGVPLETLRGWVRRLRRKAAAIWVHFGRWLAALVPGRPPLEMAGSCSIDALGAIGAAARAASVVIVDRPPWSWASRLSGGALLSNTSSPWPTPD
jgi:hypothetical protein